MKLTIDRLSKTYSNGVRAIHNVSLTLENGMFGLLGPNGAGKSSLMRTIATLQEPDSGSISLDDINVLTDKSGLRKRLGYLPQEFGVYPRISALQMLDHGFLQIVHSALNGQLSLCRTGWPSGSIQIPGAFWAAMTGSLFL